MKTFYLSAFSAFCSSLFCRYRRLSANVLLSTTTLLPGETLRVEVDGLIPDAKLKALFMGKSYPFFVVGPNAQRALIGIKLDAKPGSYGLTFKTPVTPGARP